MLLLVQIVVSLFVFIGSWGHGVIQTVYRDPCPMLIVSALWLGFVSSSLRTSPAQSRTAASSFDSSASQVDGGSGIGPIKPFEGPNTPYSVNSLFSNSIK